MVNKEYWDKFYTLDIAPTKESSFARFVYNYIVESNLKNSRLIDVACGNGRDTFYFHDNGVDSTGVDLSAQLTNDDEEFTFIHENIIDFDYNGYELIYLRFIVHALKEDELDQLLERIIETATSPYLFIETRSSKGVTDESKSETYFKSPIGDEHFRMLYSEQYLIEKLKEKFDILYVNEDTGFSPFKGADPVCIRYILKKK